MAPPMARTDSAPAAGGALHAASREVWGKFPFRSMPTVLIRPVSLSRNPLRQALRGIGPADVGIVPDLVFQGWRMRGFILLVGLACSTACWAKKEAPQVAADLAATHGYVYAQAPKGGMASLSVRPE